MKKLFALLFVLCLVVSCSHKTSPKYSAATTGTATESTTVTTTETTPPPPPPVVETNEPVSVAVTNVVVTNPPPVEVEKAVAAATNALPGRLRSPFGRPPQPTIPAPAGATASSTTPAVQEPLLPAKSIDFRAAPLETVLQVYADFVNRTLLRASALPQATITLTTQSPMTKTELIQALDAVLGLNGITMIPVGDKFLKVVPAAQANSVAAEFNDQPAANLPKLGSYVTHVVQLKYAKPTELVPVLQPFASQIPNPILPIDSSGILVLRDYTENVKRMLEMVERVDTIAQPDVISEVIPIKYALASDIANALNNLSGGGGGTTSFGSSGGGGTGSMGTTRATGATGIGARPGTTGTTGTTYNRQGTTSGGIGGGGVGGGGIGSGGLGSSGAAGGSFSDRVRNLIQRASSGGGAGEFQILGQTKIIADERTNSLLIFASRQDMEMIKDVVSKLDVVLAQVLIEAIIMEVSLNHSKDFGVSAAQQQQNFGKNSIIGGVNNGQPFFGTGSSNSFPGNLTSALPGGSGNSLSYWGNFGDNWQVAVQAAASDSRINVLSKPRIQTSHGVEADLFVGQSVPYITGTTYGDFAGVSSRSSYEEKQIGITLKVKPLINPDGLVVMDIYQDIGQRGTDVIIDGNPVPQVNQRQASATVAVKDRDTIILGGFISTTKSKTKAGVPYLQDIPLLGNLFRSTSDSQDRVELVVLLRPTVLPTPEAAAMVAKTDRKNLPGVRRAEAEFKADEAVRIKQADKDLGPNDEKLLKN